MTRDEASLLYTGKATMISRIIDSKKLGSDDPEILNWWECNLIQYEELIEVLKGPQPDPITGLVPCGCGGKAELENIEYDGDNWRVTCKECQTTAFETVREMDGYWGGKESAIENWNRAMGFKEADNG